MLKLPSFLRIAKQGASAKGNKARGNARGSLTCRRSRIEPLEDRCLLSVAPTMVPISELTVYSGAPLHILLDGHDDDGDDLTYTVTTSNPNLNADILEGNESLRLDVDDFGVMEFQLFQQRAPRTTGRIAELVQSGYYDGKIFHRVIETFMIQAGSRDGLGRNGSGVTFDDEFHPELQHTSAGLLSMAKSDDDTNDSQFFVTSGVTRHLDFNHSIFGLLTAGEDVRAAIATTSVDAGDRPLTDVVISSAEIFTDSENAVLMLSAQETAEGNGGQSIIKITVSDGNGNTAQQSVLVTFMPDSESGPNANANPYLGPIDDIRLTTGTSTTFTLPGIDIEGDAGLEGNDLYYDAIIRRDPPVVAEPIIVDNTDAGFSISGDWDWAANHGYGPGLHSAHSGDGSSEAVWTFSVPPGTYRIATTWLERANKATDAPYTITDGDTVLETVEVNQELAPNDFYDLGSDWETLGVYEVTSGTLSVHLSNDADEYVLADAVMVDPLPMDLQIDNDTGEITITASSGMMGIGEILVGVSDSAWDIQALPVIVAPLAPTSVELLASSDTGASNDDRLTKHNNSAGNEMTFRVDGLVNGLTVRLLADGVMIGEAVASGGEVEITTDGLQILDDQVHSITAVQVMLDQPLIAGNRDEIIDVISDPSPAVEITVDSTAVVFLSTPVDQATVGVPYEYDVQTDAELAGEAAYSLLQPQDLSMQIDSVTGQITWTPEPGDGPTVSVVVLATDLAGNETQQSFELAVQWPDHYPGDANLDGTTDVRDFMIWNTNKFTSGTDWSTGDFDGNGVTDVRDFMIWNTHKFTSAPTPAPVDAVASQEADRATSDAHSSLDADLLWALSANGEAADKDNPLELATDQVIASYF